MNDIFDELRHALRGWIADPTQAPIELPGGTKMAHQVGEDGRPQIALTVGGETRIYVLDREDTAYGVATWGDSV